MSERTSEWPSTLICILGYSGLECTGQVRPVGQDDRVVPHNIDPPRRMLTSDWKAGNLPLGKEDKRKGRKKARRGGEE